MQDKKQINERLKLAAVTTGVIAALYIAAIALSHNSKKESVSLPSVTEAADTEENMEQREKLFAHLGLSSENYKAVQSRCTDNALSQWWYKNKDDDALGVYIAIGDIQANGGNGFAEFDEGEILVDGDEQYELEITVGDSGEDGYMDENGNMRSYYFLQESGNLQFVNMVQN